MPGLSKTSEGNATTTTTVEKNGNRTSVKTTTTATLTPEDMQKTDLGKALSTNNYEMKPVTDKKGRVQGYEMNIAGKKYTCDFSDQRAAMIFMKTNIRADIAKELAAKGN